ncbi:MAG: peroxiredoxin [Candidatus Thermoplasmatota archaeon]|jgi:peroxiredoxin|nr:peroxiredoxin [Candidatus Thermoplasmatota archaeon]MCL5987748.1 peroxiredoxin [Candidatus Thermoplasmatota archaeon]
MSIKVGDFAPDFELADTKNKLRKLSEFKGNKVVLAFFPGAFTGVCTKEMCTFRDSMSAFNNTNAKVIGISVDTPFTLSKFASENNLQFDLLSDHAKKTIEKYGIVHKGFVNIPYFDVAKRSVYVLDRDGKVTYAWVSEVPTVEPDYGQIKAELEKIK